MAEREAIGEVVVHGSGRVSGAAHSYARDKITQVVKRAPRQLLYAKIDLIAHADPARDLHALAKAELDLSGTIVRAHAEAQTMLAAIDLLEARLAARFEHLRSDASRRRDGDHVWHHGDQPTQRHSYFPRPIDEREIVRRKTFAVEALTADEAALDLEQLDHDFYLFRDAASGSDAVIRRADDGGHELVAPSDMNLDDAVELLDLGDLPFVFFRDPATSRGAVVYRRYDGHYGLVTPADSAERERA
jgi:ribosome-associated translation inhibitor RaiA